MGKKIRINGYDTNALTRQESITDKKKITGYNSQTYQKGNETKQKMQIALEEDFETLEQIEDMLSNPKFQTTKVMGLQENEKVIVHNNNFKHGHGVLNHIAADGVEVKEFGVKSDTHFIDKEDKWQIVVEEDFNSTNFPSNVSVNNIQASSGLANQERSITYHNKSNGATLQKSTDSNYGGQSLKLDNLMILELQNTAMYNNFDAEFVWKHTNGSQGTLGFVLSRQGYNYSTNVSSFIRFVLGTNEILLLDSFGTTQTYKSKVNLVGNIWYNTRIVKINKDIVVYLNGVKVADFRLKNDVFGNFAFYPNYSSVYLDKLVIKTIPHEMLSLPNDSSTVEDVNTYETPYGKTSKVFGKKLQEFEHGVPVDSKLHFNFREGKGKHLNDKSGNENNGSVEKATWTDGYFYDALQMRDSGVFIDDDSSISDLSEFNLHTRFKLQNLDQTTRGLQANPIVSKGHEFAVYDYKRSNEVIGHWTLNGDTVDKSGFNKNLTNNNVTFSNNGKIGNAAYFNGSSASLTYSNSDAHFDRNIYTISMWVKPQWTDGAAGYNPCLIAIRDNPYSSNSRFSIHIGSSTGQYDTFGIYNRSTSYQTSKVSSFAKDVWTHVLVTFGEIGNNANVYLNGKLEAVLDQGFYDDQMQTLRIGSTVNAEYFQGFMEDIRIYKRKLDTNEIEQIYNEGSGTYNKLNLHRLAFEVYGELLIGDTIEENEWIEAWLSCDGKSSFIHRRVGQEVVPEARLPLGTLKVYMPFDDLTADDKSAFPQTTYDRNLDYTTSGLGKLNYYMDISDAASPLEYAEIENGNNNSEFNLNILRPDYESRTIAIWVKKSTDNDTGYFWSLPFNGSGQYNFQAYHSTSTLYIKLWNFNTNAIADVITIDNSIVPANAWCHVVVVFDKGYAQLYIDGVMIKDGTYSHGTGTPSSGNSFLHMAVGTLYPYGGSHSSPNADFTLTASYDDFRYYDKALTDEEVKFLYIKNDYSLDMNVNSTGYENYATTEGGLLAHYKFNNTTYDNSIHKRNLVTSGSITYTDGKIDRGVVLNGSSALELPSLLPLHDAFSIAFWVNLQSNNRGIIFASLDNSGTTPWFAIDKQSNNKIRFEIQTSNGNNFYDSSVLSLSTWYHVTCTYDNGRMQTYINGSLDASDDHSGFVSNANNTMAIGKYGGFSSSPSYFNGYLDDFRIYNHALDENEIAKIYNSGNGTENEHFKTLTMDLLDLQDKFYLPHRHLDGISQVRVWDLEYDSINNPMMESILVNENHIEGTGSYSKTSNVYKDNPHMTNFKDGAGGGFGTDRWDTDTPSKFENYSISLINQYDWIIDDDTSFRDYNKDDRQYQQTWSMWVKKIQDGLWNSLYLLFDSGTTHNRIILAIGYSNPSTPLMLVSNDSTNERQVYLTGQYTVPEDTWFKCDIVYDHGVWKLYLNGKLEAIKDDSANKDYFQYDPALYLRHDGYNEDYLLGRSVIYNRALTEQEIKERFIYDPINPYYNSKQIFSKNYVQDSKNAVFIENGLFGMLVHKAQPALAKATNGGVDFYRWDNGWKSVGKLMTEKSD